MVDKIQAIRLKTLLELSEEPSGFFENLSWDEIDRLKLKLWDEGIELKQAGELLEARSAIIEDMADDANSLEDKVSELEDMVAGLKEELKEANETINRLR